MFRRAADEVIIAVAHAARFDLHQHLAGARRIEIQRFDLNGLLRSSDEFSPDFHGWPTHNQDGQPIQILPMISQVVDSSR